ncbi:uncharacterized protein LOC129608818 [Condylostylus longicornis]|uniref:uncharacterized protein LOC129608818 n=1 Tax=Condylostylus longicornis TaxID=2530218 RepID=UPI00244E225B|nr:uncharacterized protein LOC129608818 [Condylostylus longicornis]
MILKNYDHGDDQTISSDTKSFLNDKYIDYMKLKKSLKKIRPKNRICELAQPKHHSSEPGPIFEKKFKFNNQIINLDVRPRTRLEQLAFPRVRFRSRVWSKKDWKKHTRALKKLSKPKRIFLPQRIETRLIPLEELLPRIKKLCKPRKLFLPPSISSQKKKPDLIRIFNLAKPKEFDATIFIKPEPPIIDRNKPFKAKKRTLELAEPKDRSTAESDMKENPFQVAPNALKFKLKDGGRLVYLAKPKENEEPSLNPYAFTVKKKALKAKTTKRTKELAKPRIIKSL